MFELKDDLMDTVKHYPLLGINENDGVLSLSGEIEIFHPTEKKVIDIFSLEINFTKNFPYCFPKVIETSGKIEKIIDRHVIVNKNNSLCFTVVAEELTICRLGITTRWFLDNVLVPRLAEEYLVNHGGKYAHEFSHGPLGDLEYYYQKFNIKDPKDVIGYLKFILKGEFPKHFERCICGSGLKFKKCHRRIFEDLKATGDSFINYEITQLEEFFKASK